MKHKECLKLKSLKTISIVIILSLGLCSCVDKTNDATELSNKLASTESITETDVFVIDGKKGFTDSIELNIPDGYVSSKSGNSLKLTNEYEDLTITIEEYEYTNDSFNEYIVNTVTGFSRAGAEVTEQQSIHIGQFDMKRYIMTIFPYQIVNYYVDIGDKAILLSITSNNRAIPIVKADELVKVIDISLR